MIKILNLGDFYPKDRVTKLIEEKDYKFVLGEVIEYTKQADYSIVNLEVPVVEIET